MTTLLHFLLCFFSAPFGREDEQGYGPLPLLLVACWSLTGCAPSPTGPQSVMVPAAIIPPGAVVKHSLTPQNAPIYNQMAPVSYKPMSAVITPRLPKCPPLHWESSPGWGGLVISGPALETLDFYNTGCPQYPRINVARAWLTETTDYLLPYEGKTEFAKILPFETE